LNNTLLNYQEPSDKGSLVQSGDTDEFNLVACAYSSIVIYSGASPFATVLNRVPAPTGAAAGTVVMIR
jgi:hypothetical protein